MSNLNFTKHKLQTMILNLPVNLGKLKIIEKIKNKIAYMNDFEVFDDINKKTIDY